LKFYGDTPADIDVPDATMYEMLAQSAERHPDRTALVYMGRKFTYTALIHEVGRCAAAFSANGVQAGDTVLVALPNIPNAIIVFYALNRIGARAAMAHPLSSSTELAHYLNETGAIWVVAVDMFYGRFQPILDQTPVRRLLMTHFSDYLSQAKAIGFRITKGRKIDPPPKDDPSIVDWRDFLRGAGPEQPYERRIAPTAGSVVLFSGGTTNLPKGIELSSANFNALAVSMILITGFSFEHSVLAILPVFHGFGLGLCVHTAMSAGACSILVPEFSAKIYIDNLIKHRPSFIAGVPTLFQALLREERFAKVDFSGLVGAYSGGDSLTADMKRRFDQAIADQGGSVELVEGYGLTESVTACVVSPVGHYRDNSMGVPMPGMLVKVVDPDSGQELEPGQTGEICIAGPTLMNCYVNDPEATAETLRRHADGRLWLHSGDIGSMDADGFVYFVNRIKRIIKVSGVTVYPTQVEQVLESHPSVWRACVIGTPDDYQISSVKAFVVLSDRSAGSDQIRDELIAYCKKHLIRWAVPRGVEFCAELPTTLVGKIAYTELERADLDRTQAAEPEA
jgi:long-chain acyl-CoA synthetase